MRRNFLLLRQQGRWASLINSQGVQRPNTVVDFTELTRRRRPSGHGRHVRKA